MVVKLVPLGVTWLSPLMIYITSYYGKNVFGGDQKNDLAKYEDGVKMGMYGLALFAGIQWLYSFVLPAIVKTIGVRASYLLSQLLATVCFVLFLFFDKNLPVVLVLTGLLAINFTTFNSIPFALIASDDSKEDAGLYMGVLNSASVVAQTITNLISGAIVLWKNEDVAWGIAFGGILSVIACLCVFLIRPPSTEKATNEERTALVSTQND